MHIRWWISMKFDVPHLWVVVLASSSSSHMKLCASGLSPKGLLCLFSIGNRRWPCPISDRFIDKCGILTLMVPSISYLNLAPSFGQRKIFTFVLNAKKGAGRAPRGTETCLRWWEWQHWNLRTCRIPPTAEFHRLKKCQFNSQVFLCCVEQKPQKYCFFFYH